MLNIPYPIILGALLDELNFLSHNTFRGALVWGFLMVLRFKGGPKWGVPNPF